MNSLEKIVKIALISGAASFSSLSLDSCVAVSQTHYYSYPIGSQENAKELIKRYKQGEREFRGENLTNAYLRYEILSSADFSKANFYQANLEGSHFYYSNFNSARFFQANLNNVKALYSTFTGADMYKSILTKGHFDYSDFSYANLGKTDLRYADFSNSKFRTSDFNQSNVSNAIFIEADLREVKNLENAIGLADAKYKNTIVTEIEYLIITKKLSEKGINIDRINQDLFIIK
ncbi:pentapeptide repeat-containing protein [Candidatus Woesearchaeota archaeon]|jgi:uncharacterized protein YjbI with pentapeptide repeats|nr:pentapeptide repeat-containing protein [Candidatus Woesearchaeota archaeon]